MNDIVWGLFTGFIIGFALSVILALAVDPGEFSVICEYEGGEVQGNVCLVDDKVFLTND